MCFYEFEVLYHAHVVFGAVAFVKGLQPTAGELLAFITKPYKAVPQSVTLLLHKSTFFAAWQTTRAILLPKSLLLQVVLHC